MILHLLTWSLHQAPVKRVIALLPTTMTYASTSAQHGPYAQPLLKTYDITANLAL